MNENSKSKMFKNKWEQIKQGKNRSKEGQTCKNNCEKLPNKKKGNRLTSFFVRFAEVSQTFLSKKKVMDRESPRGKKKTHVIETRKDEVQKRDNRWTHVWAKMT